MRVVDVVELVDEEVELEVDELDDELDDEVGSDVDDVDDVEELSNNVVLEEVAVPRKYWSAGRVNGQDASPWVARVMYFCQIVDGSEPPVTEMPCTDFMNDPSG